MKCLARPLSAGLVAAVLFAGCSSKEPAGVEAKPPAEGPAAATAPAGAPPAKSVLDRKSKPNTEVLETN